MMMRKRGDSAIDEEMAGGGGVATMALPESPVPNSEKSSALQAVLQFELTPKKVKRKDLMHFSRQMAVFIKAGIPIIDALETIASEVKHKFFKLVLDEAVVALRAGSTFSGA